VDESQQGISDVRREDLRVQRTENEDTPDQMQYRLSKTYQNHDDIQ
jgi:hypothetical protein